MRALGAYLAALLGLGRPPAPQAPSRVTHSTDTNVQMPLPLLVDLAVEAWRLDRWLGQFGQTHPTAAGRFASRRIGDILGVLEVETIDLSGQSYDPGLALELLGTVDDDTLPPGTVVIDEMVTPLCLWQGRVVRHGQVVTRSSAQGGSEGEDA